MTLNITVVTNRCIYQSADHRLTDTMTGKPCDFEAQKIAFVNTYGWSATVCFSGVGRTRDLDVGKWLLERTAAIGFDDPIDKLFAALASADDDWLLAVPERDRRHSFSVGAFVGSEPIFALVSNFERLFERPERTVAQRLTTHTFRPTKARAFISGQSQTLTRAERRRLEALAAKDPEPQRMCLLLAEVNRSAARRNEKVSLGCFTTHLRLTGDGGGQAHGPSSQKHSKGFAIPDLVQGQISQIADKHFGPGKYQMVAFSAVRANATDDYHQTQLREKPLDPNAHSNYGAYLKDKKGDAIGAEREYRKAIELNENHTNALGNLANLLWEESDIEQADSLYRKALAADPGHENVTWNYARFLVKERGDQKTAGEILDRAVVAHPESARLHLLHADISLMAGNASDALEWFRTAREKGADQAAVEAGYAYALQLTNAPIGESIAAYYVAISLNPRLSALKLNLAQLLFIEGDDKEAGKNLREAMELGLDDSAMLEAQFYLLLSDTLSDPTAIFQTISSLLCGGARLRWNVQPNIEVVKRRIPGKAALLKIISQVMTGEHDQALLGQMRARWPTEANGH